MTVAAQTPAPDRAGRRFEAFRVAPWVHHCGRLVAAHPRFWIRLGHLETRLRAADIEDVAIERPVFVCGLARAGTTILLETLARHPQLGSHRYRDDPFLFTPIFWNVFLGRLPLPGGAPAERAHADGIAVTAESPEAFEEAIWMAFFDALHDPQRNAVLDAETALPAFETFYRDHIRKLLWVRRRSRYLAKANYHVTRLEYLLKLFPDARFLLPLRDPVAHVGSLMKQHRLFCEGERRHPRALRHMQRIGHFEFGLDRRPINVGDGTMDAILEAFGTGDEVRGWSLYWASLHGWLARRLAGNDALRAAVQVVSFEDLCKAPGATLERVFDHAALPDCDNLIAEAAARLQMPTYYKPGFQAAEAATIRRLTDEAFQRLRSFAV